MIVADLGQATGVRLSTLREHASVRSAAAAFDHGQVGLIVVCDDVGRATGVVTKSDLVRHIALAGQIGAPVADIMSRSIISGRTSDDLQDTWSRMLVQRLQNLPLLAPDDRPVGTLDIRDAVQALLSMEQEQEQQLINYIAGCGYR